jgi:hypothetical protein
MISNLKNNVALFSDSKSKIIQKFCCEIREIKRSIRKEKIALET